MKEVKSSAGRVGTVESTTGPAFSPGGPYVPGPPPPPPPPPPVLTNCVAWYEAMREAFQDTARTVPCVANLDLLEGWEDQASAGNAQDGIGDVLWVTPSQGMKPAALVGGAAGSLALSSPLVLTAPFTVYLVASLGNLAGGDFDYIFSNSGGDAWAYFQSVAGGTPPDFVAIQDDMLNANALLGLTPPAGYALYRLRVDASGNSFIAWSGSAEQQLSGPPLTTCTFGQIMTKTGSISDMTASLLAAYSVDTVASGDDVDVQVYTQAVYGLTL
jgi:hypothetical protein